MTFADAQQAHTIALRHWLCTKGPDEPAALAALDQARATLRDSFAAHLLRIGW